MESKSFSYNGATVTVRTETGRMYIRRLSAQFALGLSAQGPDGKRLVTNDEFMERTQFAAVFVQSEVEGDLGFVWPESVHDASAMQTACEGWLNLPVKVIRLWMEAINEVDTPPNDPDLLPPESVQKKGSKTPT